MNFVSTLSKRISFGTAKFHLNSPICLLHTRLKPPHKEKLKWNTSHVSVLENPLLCLLEKCGNMRQLKQIQAQMVVTGLISDGFAASRLISFCAISESADLDYCCLILFHVENSNVFSWNVAIRGYSESDRPERSVVLYKQMMRLGTRPNNLSYPFMFKACGRILGISGTAGGVFGHVLQLGLDSDIFVQNAIIHFFSACGEFGYARKLFDGSLRRDLVSWNSLINGYARRGCPKEGLGLFQDIKREEIRPDEVTMIGTVSCCAQLEDLNLGRVLHRYIEENGIRFTVPLTNALMDMYVKCGSLDPARLLFAGMEKKTAVSWTTMIVGYLKFGMLDAARGLFCEMPEKDIVPWNAMISGYVQCKQEKEALALFHEMQQDSFVKPCEVTMVSLLSACSQIGALDIGLWLHHYIDRQFSMSVPLGTALVDMYAKCGNIQKALSVFETMPKRNALTWTAIICGLAAHGHGQDAISYFLKMIDAGLLPDDVTFVGVLSACCHSGLIDEGRKYFAQMQSKYNLQPRLKHYSCMVDLLGRAGFLDEAEELVKSMPMKPDPMALGALFFACRVHGNVPMGERAASELLKLDPHDSGIYVLLANMYAEANMREKASKIRVIMRKRQVQKTPGCSSIEVNGIVHEFIVRDKSHPQSKDIHTCLILLAQHMELG